jgi:F0F1-type ATP synthase epsilon subunit
MTTEAEINAKHFPIINALADKVTAAKRASRAAFEAYFRTHEGLRDQKGGEAWIAYEAALAARKAAEADLERAFDARTADKKKLNAASRKAARNR